MWSLFFLFRFSSAYSAFPSWHPYLAKSWRRADTNGSALLFPTGAVPPVVLQVAGVDPAVPVADFPVAVDHQAAEGHREDGNFHP